MQVLKNSELTKVSGGHVVVDLSGINISVALTDQSDALFLMLNKGNDLYWFSNDTLNDERKCTECHNLGTTYYSDPDYSLLVGDICQFQI